MLLEHHNWADMWRLTAVDTARILRLLQDRTSFRAQLRIVDDQLNSVQASMTKSLPGSLTIPDLSVGNKLVAFDLLAEAIMPFTVEYLDEERGVGFKTLNGTVFFFTLEALGVVPGEDAELVGELVWFTDDPDGLRGAINWLQAKGYPRLVRSVEQHLRYEHSLTLHPVEDGGFAFASTDLRDPGNDIL